MSVWVCGCVDVCGCVGVCGVCGWGVCVRVGVWGVWGCGVVVEGRGVYTGGKNLDSHWGSTILGFMFPLGDLVSPTIHVWLWVVWEGGQGATNK